MSSFLGRGKVGIPLVLSLGIICLAQGLWAYEFAGGTGEPNDPYQIATAEQLISIGLDPNLADKHFVLVNDIDLDPNLPGRKVFNQAVMQWHITQYKGLRASTLYGSFDGDGHVIRNCVLVTGQDTVYAGFFGAIAPQGVVRDLHIQDMTIVDLAESRSSYFYPGLLAAFNQGTVIDCSASGSLMIHSGGGLIGRNAGIVVGCRACCDIVGEYIGGLIGHNEETGRVVLCESDGLLHADPRAGGIVSYNGGTVQYCKVGGSVSAIAAAGGLASVNVGLIRECWAAATVESGGGIAYNNDGTIVNCYATGAVSGTTLDGLVVDGYGRIVSSYSTTVSHPRYTPKIQYVYYLDVEKPEGLTGSPFTRNTIALSQAQMTRRSSFIGFDFYGDAIDGPADQWFMPADGFPVLTWQTEITGLAAVPNVSGLSLEQARAILEAAGFEPNVCHDYAEPRPVWPGKAAPTADTKGKVIATRPMGVLQFGRPVTVVLSLGKYDFGQNSGDGSEEKPFRIETAGQLEALDEQDDLVSRHFELVADIDLSGYDYPDSLIRVFHGDLNGNGHTIRNLQCGRGLIDRLGSDGSVHDLIVSDAWVHNMPIDQSYGQVSSAWDIAILICENWGGLVFGCDVTGQIFGGSSAVGGLVGANQGALTDCRFRGRIRPVDESSWVGGLVGTNSGSIIRSCALNVEVLGNNGVGGLVGWNSPVYTSLEACYATGTVHGINFIGGLVGQYGTPSSGGQGRGYLMPRGVIRDCYAACSVTGQQEVGGFIGLTAVTDADLESCFYLGSEDGGGPDNGLATVLTVAQMKQQDSFVGWDFNDIWTICEGRDYPRLKWEQRNCSEW